jgi:ligand-binding SRPBCC domain-containing protein
MPTFISEEHFALPVARIFAFFRRPGNRVRLARPELHMQLLDGPEQIELGSRLTVRVRRAGVSQQITSEVTAFTLDVSFVEEQRKGPFRRWVHTYRFEASDGSTRMTEVIDYEPPGGMLGLLLTAGVIERDLTALYAYRRDKLPELLADE